MPMLKLPKPRREEINTWRGISKGLSDLDFYSAFGVDFEEIPGLVVPSEPMKQIITSSSLTNFMQPQVFLRTDTLRTTSTAAADSWWIMANGRWWTSLDVLGTLGRQNIAHLDFALVQDDGTNTPTGSTDDGIIFVGHLIAPTATNLNRKPSASNTWDSPWYSTLTGASALTSNQHPLDVFLNKLLIGDGRFLNTVDDSFIAVDPALTFPNEFVTNKILHSGDFSYIACNNIGGKDASVFGWNGTSGVYDQVWSLHSRNVMSGVIVNGIPIFLNHKGQFEAFNGAGFEIIAEFPVARELGDSTALGTNWVHRNGMVHYEDGILINAGGDITYNRMPSGIWYLNLKTGNLYQRYSFRNSSVTNDNQRGHAYTSQTDVGAIVNSGNQFGRFAAGAVLRTDTGGGILRGLHVPTFDTNSTDQRRSQGYFITSVFNSKDAVARWNRIKLKMIRFINSNEYIEVHYKVRNAPAFDFSFDSLSGGVDTEPITWTASNTFTGVLRTGRAVGNSVEILSGANAGLFTRISALSATPNGSATITVTLEDTGPSTSGTSVARFDEFVFLGRVAGSTGSGQSLIEGDEKIYSIIKRNNWIQFLVILRSFDRRLISPALRELLVEFNEYPK